MELNGTAMDTRKEMMIELIKEKTRWDKSVVIEDHDDRVVIYDEGGIVSGALLESLIPVANAFGSSYYATVRNGCTVLMIILK